MRTRTPIRGVGDRCPSNWTIPLIVIISYIILEIMTIVENYSDNINALILCSLSEAVVLYSRMMSSIRASVPKFTVSVKLSIRPCASYSSSSIGQLGTFPFGKDVCLFDIDRFI